MRKPETVIRVDKATRDVLQKLKSVDSTTYNDTINRLMFVCGFIDEKNKPTPTLNKMVAKVIKNRKENRAKWKKRNKGV